MRADKYRLKSSARLVSVLNADNTLFAKNWWLEPLAAAFRLTLLEFQDVVQEEAQWLTTHVRADCAPYSIENSSPYVAMSGSEK